MQDGENENVNENGENNEKVVEEKRKEEVEEEEVLDA